MPQPYGWTSEKMSARYIFSAREKQAVSFMGLKCYPSIFSSITSCLFYASEMAAMDY